jgi:hypothetical protein
VRRSHAVGVVWAAFAVVVAAVVATYSRIAPDRLYGVTGRGFVHGGLSRAVVYVNFPVSLAAVALLAATLPRFSRRKRFAALVAVLLCVPIVSTHVVDQKHLDARWTNAIPAAGVLLALVVTTTTPLYRPERVRGDGVRVAVGALLTLLALPWIAAELGFSFGGTPVLGQVFQTSELRRQPGRPGLHPAVHLGDHHGLECTLLVLTALLLSRTLGAVRRRLPHAVLGLWVSLLIAYGLANVANDAWLEQVVKRGWTAREIPNVLVPAANAGWLAIVLGTLVLWLTCFRPRYPRRTEPTATSSAISPSV